MRSRSALILMVTLASTTPLAAQENNAAAERARLGEQRVQAEASQRAREEEERSRQQQFAEAEAARLAAAARAPAPSAEPVPSATVPTPVNRQPRASGAAAVQATVSAPLPPASAQSVTADPNLSLMLEQLRQLGELKAAGVVNDDEFERIKQRILDGKL
ncbi:MAG: SHOCT domain-containing protein [Pseudomonadota bacterium]